MDNILLKTLRIYNEKHKNQPLVSEIAHIFCLHTLFSGNFTIFQLHNTEKITEQDYDYALKRWLQTFLSLVRY